MQSVQSPAESEELRRAPNALARGGLVDIAEALRMNDSVYTPMSLDAPFFMPVPVGAWQIPDAPPNPPFIDRDNQICIAQSSTPLVSLQNQLAEHGLSLPIGSRSACRCGFAHAMNLRQAIDLNLPHSAESESGNWRDWIIGMTVVLGDGTVAKSGSQAVKSVAGYDAHKLFIGAMGTLGIITKVILRVSATPRPWDSVPDTPSLENFSIHRVLPSDFEAALEQTGRNLIDCDPPTGTIWRHADGPIPRFPNDWLRQTGVAFDPGPLREYYRRAKQLLDPQGKLNVGRL